MRLLTERDAPLVQELVRICPPLEVHTAFTYWVLCRYQIGYGVVAEDASGSIVGVVTGIASASDPEVVYLWQIGVAPDRRRNGLGRKLLTRWCLQLQDAGRSRLEVSIAPGNGPSRRLFGWLAREQDSALERIRSVVVQDESYATMTDEDIFAICLRSPARISS